MVKLSTLRALYLSIIVISFGCASAKKLETGNLVGQANYSIGGKMYTAAFQQRAAEYKALCLQGYNIARWQIANYKPQTSKPLAIITDIDETILDNSPFAVHQGLLGKEYESAAWKTWTDKASADTMPGAAAFLKEMSKAGITVFYITNRNANEQQATIQNLSAFNLPNADVAHVLTRQSTSSKEERRNFVLGGHEVILLMGDNLADFTAVFEKKTEVARAQAVNELAGQFGNFFIVFPNANYGDWESAIYGYNNNFTQLQKDSVLKATLKSY